MALSAGEYLSGGQVRDSQGRTVVISETAGAALSAGEQYSGGYPRDADGRVVICQDTLNAALGAGEQYSGGDVRDSQGRAAVAVDTANSALSGSEQISGGQVRDSLGRRVMAIDTLGAALSVGEFFSGGNVLDKVGRTVVALESGGGGGTYDTVVAADAPTYWWKLGDAAGTTAVDSADANPGTYVNPVGVTLGQTGIPQSPSKAALFTAASSPSVSTAVNVTGMATIEAWFKVAAGPGMPISVGPSGAERISLVIDTTGHVVFSIWIGSRVSITTPGTYVDSAWHHVVGVLAANNNMTLYVDGGSIGSNANVTAPTQTNHIQVAGNNTIFAGFFNGTLTHAAAYNTPLSAAAVLNHYNAGH